jgi:hypothetical protein
MFDFVEETFDQMALLINEPIDLAGFGAVTAGRDDGLHAPRLDGLDERVVVVALVAGTPRPLPASLPAAPPPAWHHAPAHPSARSRGGCPGHP